MIADSVAFCREQGKRVVFDAEHFFDGYRDDAGLRARVRCAAAAEAGAENVTLCDTNGGSLPDFVGEATAAVVAALGGEVEIGIHTHNDAECAVANSLAAVEAGRAPGAGDASTATASAAATPTSPRSCPALQLKMGFDVVSDEQLAEPDRDRPLPRRALQHDPGPRPALRRPQRLRPQGGDARRRGRRRRPHLRAPRPGRGRQRARRSCPRSSRARRRSAPRPSRPGSRSTTRRRRGRSSG